MFEQHLFDQESPVEPLRKGDLFYHYEIKNWEFTPRMYKIIAFSAIFNILFLFGFAQGNLLTRRGCDSPFTRSICQVVDTVYVGMVLASTGGEYVNEDYDKIDLGNADITYIDVSNDSPPLVYPEGYFQIANPEQFAMMQQNAMNPPSGFQTIIPGIPQNLTLGGGLMNTTPITPPANPNAISGEPSSPFKIGDNPASERKTRRGGRPFNNKANSNANISDADLAKVNGDSNSNTNAEVQPKADPTDPVTDLAINKKPLVDLANDINLLQEKKEVDLQTPFILEAQGRLTKDGRLDPKNFRYTKAASNDAEMIDVVKQSIEAINVAGFLQYLEKLNGKDLNLHLEQDAENFSAVVQSSMESENRANAVKSALDLLISVEKSRKSVENADQNDKDGLQLLETAKIETDGKKIVISFTAPKSVIHPMIQRKLAEQAAAAKTPSGSALTTANNNNSK